MDQFVTGPKIENLNTRLAFQSNPRINIFLNQSKFKFKPFGPKRRPISKRTPKFKDLNTLLDPAYQRILNVQYLILI